MSLDSPSAGRPETDVDVMIVGAGPTGLALAVDLVRRGVEVALIEEAPALPRESRGKGLQPRTMEVLEDLGVVDAILAHGEARQDISLYCDGRRVARLPAGLARSRSDLPYPNIVMIPQWCTTAVLADRLRELGAVVRFGTRLESFTVDNQAVRAVSTSPDGGRVEVTARFLVGCDGGHSLVRRILGLEFAGTSDEARCYLLGDVTVPGWEPEVGGAVRSHAWFGVDGSFLGLAGLPGAAQWQIGASVPVDDAVEPTLGSLQRLWDERTGHHEVRLAAATWLSNFRVNVRMVDTYRRGPVLLAGDAAHVHPPTGGQGMNTGIQDAYNLGWKLAACLDGHDDALLDSYQAERLPVARRALKQSTDILDVVTNRNPLVRFAVHRLLLPMLSRPALNRLLTARVSQIDIGYRDGPLAEGRSVGGRVRAGDRAPDAHLVDATGRPLRLFDLLRGPHWTLLLVGEAAAQHLDVEVLPDDVHAVMIADPQPTSFPGRVVGDRGRSFRRSYRARPGTAVLIRPDGYVRRCMTAPRADAVTASLGVDRAAGPDETRRPGGGRFRHTMRGVPR
ncbi:FAD-dependent monooxygenase [Pseudonocardia abyssalis]|uniref:FAD-dependent monooxygenase n=2 Tax=Pseudonocardia abyssalis TaxID=2792008 RepID=A0ABS6UZ27_9PSEU|nr:FAD-dependent monooxygenase [Pseudonocardia abyssalis]MBW0115744.1 FAD-dependent monooxygenase [Pseudonocardia abyssalis]MBW0137417.1 FAD-dependent monooxygenase [Pseudonocardia abyssalis]